MTSLKASRVIRKKRWRNSVSGEAFDVFPMNRQHTKPEHRGSQSFREWFLIHLRRGLHKYSAARSVDTVVCDCVCVYPSPSSHSTWTNEPAEISCYRWLSFPLPTIVLFSTTRIHTHTHTHTRVSQMLPLKALSDPAWYSSLFKIRSTRCARLLRQFMHPCYGSSFPRTFRTYMCRLDDSISRIWDGCVASAQIMLPCYTICLIDRVRWHYKM